MAMELEVREIATRQKLREFKEKLQQFRADRSASANSADIPDASGSGALEQRMNSMTSASNHAPSVSDHVSSVSGSRSSVFDRAPIAWGDDSITATRHSPSDHRSVSTFPENVSSERPKFTTPDSKLADAGKFAFNFTTYNGSTNHSEDGGMVGEIVPRPENALAVGCSSMLAQSHVDHGYSSFQRMKFKKTTPRRSENFLIRPSSAIPDANVIGIPLPRKIESSGIIGDSSLNVDEFVKKLQDLKVDFNKAFREGSARADFSPMPADKRLETDFPNGRAQDIKPSMDDILLAQSSKKLSENLKSVKNFVSKERKSKHRRETSAEWRSSGSEQRGQFSDRRNVSITEKEPDRMYGVVDTEPDHSDSKMMKTSNKRKPETNTEQKDEFLHNELIDKIHRAKSRPKSSDARFKKSEFKLNLNGLVEIPKKSDRSREKRSSHSNVVVNGQKRPTSAPAADVPDARREMNGGFASVVPNIKRAEKTTGGQSAAIAIGEGKNAFARKPVENAGEYSRKLAEYEPLPAGAEHFQKESEISLAAKTQRQRVQKLRQAQKSAEIIQNAWRRHRERCRVVQVQ